MAGIIILILKWSNYISKMSKKKKKRLVRDRPQTERPIQLSSSQSFFSSDLESFWFAYLKGMVSTFLYSGPLTLIFVVCVTYKIRVSIVYVLSKASGQQ